MNSARGKSTYLYINKKVRKLKNFCKNKYCRKGGARFYLAPPSILLVCPKFVGGEKLDKQA
jgi:hypothetical protein